MLRNPFRRAWRSNLPYKRAQSPLNGSPFFTRAHASKTTSQTARIDRVISRLPPRLQRYTAGLRNAPFSHVVSFLILHELTAIVPVFALFGLFHYTDYVPVSWMTQHFGDQVQSGVARFERYFSRKGWFGFSREDSASDNASKDRKGSNEQTSEAVGRFEQGEPKYRALVEVALAYAITKVLLPVRLAVSVSATPWFAGVMARVRSTFSRKS